VNHPVETFGFRIEHGGRALAYSADTGESAALVGLARGADLLLCEASFADGAANPPDMHLTGRQAGEHAARAGAGELVLTHLVPWNDQAANAHRGRRRVRRPAVPGRLRRGRRPGLILRPVHRWAVSVASGRLLFLRHADWPASGRITVAT